MRSNVVRMLPDESQEDFDAMAELWNAQYGRYVGDNPGLVSLLGL